MWCWHSLDLGLGLGLVSASAWVEVRVCLGAGGAVGPQPPGIELWLRCQRGVPQGGQKGCVLLRRSRQSGGDRNMGAVGSGALWKSVPQGAAPVMQADLSSTVLAHMQTAPAHALFLHTPLCNVAPTHHHSFSLQLLLISSALLTPVHPNASSCLSP